MPAIPIGGVTSYVPSASTSTLNFGSILAGDVICVIVGSFFGTGYWKITDNLGNGSAVDDFNNPIYAKGAFQYHPGGKLAGFWAVSLIDGDLTVTIETNTTPTGNTPVTQPQLNIIRVYRFPKVYAIDQASVGLEGFGFVAPGGGFNCAEGTGDFSYSDTLVVSGVITIDDLDDLVSITGDVVRNDIDKPFGGGFDQKNTLYALDRYLIGPDYNENVQIKYNCGQGTVGTSMVVMTFSAPLADPPGLRDPGGKQYACRGGGGQDNNPGIIDGDQQADWNRPIVCTFPYEIKVGDFLIIDVHTFNDPDVGMTPYGPVWDEYGPGFPILITPPFINVYTRQIICPPTGSGSASAGGYTASYTCLVEFIPETPLGVPRGGIFQVHMTAPPPTSGAVYQCTAIGITAVTVSGPPLSIATAGLKSITQVVQDGLLATDPIPDVRRGSYLHAFAVLSPSGPQTTMTWTPLEDYAIPDEGHWDFFQFPSAITNQPRICGLAIEDKIAPATGTYDAQILAVLPSFAGVMVIILIAFRFPRFTSGGSALKKINRHLVPGL